MLGFLAIVTSVASRQHAKIDPSQFFHQHELLPVTISGSHRGQLRCAIPTTKDYGTNGTLVMSTTPMTSPFAADFVAEHRHSNGTIQKLDIEPERFHAGVLVDSGGATVPGSHVQLHIAPKGVISAVVHTGSGDVVHIESAHRYAVSDETSARARRQAEGVHHLVYRHADLNPASLGDHPFCGAHAPSDGSGRLRYSAAAAALVAPAVPGSPLYSAGSLSRDRRDTADCRDSGSGSNGKCDCTVALVADSFFVNSGLIESNSPAIAAQYMINLALSSDQIYRSTTFGSTNGIGLAIGRVAIDETSTLNAETSNPNTLLETFTQTQNWNNMCAAHLFTHRNFYGTLGLAYIGTLCSAENTGFHSSYGVPQVVQLVTLTHEIGHNFGSYHDETSDCTPGNYAGGNYIMYPAATTGNMRNNLVFSTCSRASMASSMSQKNCFTQSAPHCGNGIVESGEECDCGVGCSDISCCTSSCTVNTDAGYTCSPQDPIQFPCCTPEDGTSGQCQIIPASAGFVCDDEDNCDAEATCDGTSAACPAGVPKPDYDTECGCIDDDCSAHPFTGDKVCMGGVCNMSRCALTGSTQCDAPSAPCQLGCMGNGWGNGSECISTFDVANRHPSQTWGINFEAGHVCNDMTGYCNAHGSCQQVGSDLERKWSAAGAHFVRHYWWAIIMSVIALIGLQFVVMRIHRMKRRHGYESLDDSSPRRLQTAAMLRDGFEQPDAYDTADEDSSDSDDETKTEEQRETTKMHEFYERERRSVIFDAYRRQFAESETEGKLEETGLALKKVIESGNLDQRHVMELRKVYVTRLNQLRGFEEKESMLNTTFDAACESIDHGRQTMSKVWNKAVRQVKKTASEIDREIEKQEYVYY